jgi:hypothetical protein
VEIKLHLPQEFLNQNIINEGEYGSLQKALYSGDASTTLELFDAILASSGETQEWVVSVKAFMAQERKENAFSVML